MSGDDKNALEQKVLEIVGRSSEGCLPTEIRKALSGEAKSDDIKSAVARLADRGQVRLASSLHVQLVTKK